MSGFSDVRRNAPSPERLLAHYRTMARIRAFENAAERLYNEKRIPGFAIHALDQQCRNDVNKEPTAV